MSRTILQPEIRDTGTGSGRWMVVLYNNDYNTFEQVIEILMRSTGCGLEEAAIEAWEAHTFGRASVHFSTKTECEIVGVMISSVGLKTEISREWDD
jgi:ATP-dependent Clp protease adapter protein ClpS